MSAAAADQWSAKPVDCWLFRSAPNVSRGGACNGDVSAIVNMQKIGAMMVKPPSWNGQATWERPISFQQNDRWHFPHAIDSVGRMPLMSIGMLQSSRPSLKHLPKTSSFVFCEESLWLDLVAQVCQSCVPHKRYSEWLHTWVLNNLSSAPLNLYRSMILGTTPPCAWTSN